MEPSPHIASKLVTKSGEGSTRRYRWGRNTTFEILARELELAFPAMVLEKLTQMRQRILEKNRRARCALSRSRLRADGTSYG